MCRNEPRRWRQLVPVDTCASAGRLSSYDPMLSKTWSQKKGAAFQNQIVVRAGEIRDLQHVRRYRLRLLRDVEIGI
jgi:hypothetical protein